jgi:DegV family protein with EDD domain
VAILASIEVFTDSSCDYSRDYAAKEHISIVPLTVSFGDRQFKDGVDIDGAAFFRLLKENPDILPKTSAPNPDDFIKAFRSVGSDCEDIICVTISSKSSGTFNSAMIAKDILSEEHDFKPRIIIFDTYNATIAVGIIASTAADMATKGKTVDAIMKRLNEMRDRTSFYCILDTLEYLRKGGRIGTVKAVLGTLLNIKPILTFINGTPTDIDKTRGLMQAQMKLINLFIDRSANLKEVYIIHAASIDCAKGLANELGKLVKDIKFKIFEVGAVIGTYSGPGAIGLAFEEKPKILTLAFK